MKYLLIQHHKSGISDLITAYPNWRIAKKSYKDYDKNSYSLLSEQDTINCNHEFVLITKNLNRLLAETNF